MENQMNILSEPVNQNYPEGMQEITALMTFLPEPMRQPMLEMVINLCLTF